MDNPHRLEEFSYASGMFRPSGPPVVISVQGISEKLYPRVIRKVREDLNIIQPGLLIVAGSCPARVRPLRKSMFEKGPEYLDARAMHLLRAVIGSAAGPPSLRHPPAERRFDRVMYDLFEYHEVSPGSFDPTPGESDLIAACRNGLEEVLQEDSLFVSQGFGESSMVIVSPPGSALLKEALSRGVLCGVSFYHRTHVRLAQAVYNRISSPSRGVQKELGRFEQLFDLEDWPRYKKELCEEMQTYGRLCRESPEIN